MAKHRSEAERAKWVSRWRASGLSCDRFARRHGLSESSLYRWSQQVPSTGAVSASGFAEVRVVGSAAGAGLEVAHPGGCVVRMRGAVDEAQLVAVLRALGTC